MNNSIDHSAKELQRSVIILTGYDHFFGQTRKPWVSINTSALLTELANKGISAKELPFHQVANQQVVIKDSIIFYTFSQRDNLRAYINDVIFFLQSQGNLVIPSVELLRCHENKGFQECLKQSLGIDSLPAQYFSSKRELEHYQIEYPVVLKTITGSNGRGVFLIQNQTQLKAKLKEIEPRLSIWTKLDLLRRKHLRLPKTFQGYEHFDSRNDFEQYRDYITPEQCFILQKFVSGLEFDYRVIVLGERFYVTKRLTRKGDFRASGAKRFTFDFNAPDELLDYARDIFAKFNSPCLSIDVGVKDNQHYLFEFQALHFGINAIVRGKGYYQYSSSGWKFTHQKTVFESALASALAYHLSKISH